MRSVDLVEEIEYTETEVIQMTNYQKLYTLLFNAITDALRQLEEQNIGLAKQTLIRAQQAAEKMYLEE